MTFEEDWEAFRLSIRESLQFYKQNDILNMVDTMERRYRNERQRAEHKLDIARKKGNPQWVMKAETSIRAAKIELEEVEAFRATNHL